MNDTNNKLKQIVENLEHLEDQKKEIQEDIKHRMAEAKSMGFDTKIIKKVLKIRQNPEKAKEELDLLETYCAAVQLNLFESN